MDFINLATSTNSFLKHVDSQLQNKQQEKQEQVEVAEERQRRRRLDQILGISSSNDENEVSNIPTTETGAVVLEKDDTIDIAYQQQQQQLKMNYYSPPTDYNENMNFNTNHNHNNNNLNTVSTTNVPILSASSEKELYLLATNFLLYVAMVIITTLVARIYFPETLRRRRPPTSKQQSQSQSQQQQYHSRSSTATATLQRNVQYHRSSNNNTKDTTTSEDSSASDDTDDILDSNDDTDEDENNNIIIMGDDEQSADEYFENVIMGDDDDDDDDIMNDDDLNDNNNKKESKRFLDYNNGNNNNHTNRKKQHHKLSFDLERQATITHRMTRKKIIQRLLFCCFMLNITFVTWGLLQERMLTRKYPRYVGDYFTYSYALVFSNRLWTFIMSSILMIYFKPTMSSTTILYEYTFPSISNMLSSWCQYEALQYVSFPATTIMKSFKLAPVMAMGKVLGNKTYKSYDYIVALIIGVGIAMFMSSTDDLNIFKWDDNTTTTTGTTTPGSSIRDTLDTNGIEKSPWTGVLLLLLFLLFDSFTSQFQSRMFRTHVDLSMIELMFATSAFSTILSLITLIHTNEITPALHFIYEHSEIHIHILLFSICSTIGQLTIFYTIKNFGAVVFTLIMTTRILLSISISCILYGHQVSGIGFIGLIFVIAAVLYRIKRKAEEGQSRWITWQGINDEKGPILVQEWHEHVDM